MADREENLRGLEGMGEEAQEANQFLRDEELAKAKIAKEKIAAKKAADAANVTAQTIAEAGAIAAGISGSQLPAQGVAEVQEPGEGQDTEAEVVETPAQAGATETQTEEKKTVAQAAPKRVDQSGKEKKRSRVERAKERKENRAQRRSGIKDSVKANLKTKAMKTIAWSTGGGLGLMSFIANL